MTAPLTLIVTVERWPIAGSFTISRGAKTQAVVVVAELSDGTRRGRVTSHQRLVPAPFHQRQAQFIEARLDVVSCFLAP